MDIKTFEDLIDWSRQLHGHLSRSLHDSAKENQNERASALLDYLATHEAELERMTSEFEKQANIKILRTRLYDFSEHHPFTRRQSDTHYASLDFDGISEEIFAFHDELMALYQGLIRKAEVPEVSELLEQLLEMEQNESMRLARQVGSMNDV